MTNFTSLALALVLSLLTLDGFAQVQTSFGCQTINLPNQDGLYSGRSVTGPWFAGERVEIKAALPVTGLPPTVIELKVDGTIVSTDGFPGTVGHQFSSTSKVFVTVGWTGNNIAATWTATCFAALAPATPVPALNWQGIVVLVTLLAGFTYYRRRRVAG